MQSGLLSATAYRRVLSSWPLDQSSVESEMTLPPIWCTQWCCSWGSTRFVPTILCVVHPWGCLLRGLIILYQVRRLLRAELDEVKKFLPPIWRWVANFTIRQIYFSRKLFVHTAQETKLWVQRLYGLGDEENISWSCREWNFNREPLSHPLYTLSYSKSSARDEGLKVHGELQ